MSRNRLIYQSISVYAGQNNASGIHTGAGAIKQLTRVQSFDTDFSRSFQDINQFGQLAAISREEIEAPTVNMSTSWYPTDGSNEKYVGLTVTTGNMAQVSLISGILKKVTDEKNYFVLVAEEGSDTVGYVGATSGVFGLGNAFLTSYSLEASVGDIPTASADFEALNFAVYADADGTNYVPAVNPTTGLPNTTRVFELPVAVANDNATQPTVLRPGDITVNVQTAAGLSVSDLKIQRFSLSVDMSRTPIQKMGSRFAFSREIDFPLTARMSVDAQLGDLTNFNLANLLCETGTYDLTVVMKENDCSGNGAPALAATLKSAKLVSQNISTSIGDNASSTLEYEVSIAGPEDNTRGIFLSGSY